jgi:hypothetical protein
MLKNESVKLQKLSHSAAQPLPSLKFTAFFYDQRMREQNRHASIQYSKRPTTP